MYRECIFPICFFWQFRESCSIVVTLPPDGSGPVTNICWPRPQFLQYSIVQFLQYSIARRAVFCQKVSLNPLGRDTDLGIEDLFGSSVWWLSNLNEISFVIQLTDHEIRECDES